MNKDQCSNCWLPINKFQEVQYDGLCPECYKYESATIQNRMNDDQEFIEAVDEMFEQIIAEIKSKS